MTEWKISMEIPKLAIGKKPIYIKIAQDIDFFALFRVIETQFANCFLFESLGEQSSVSRYSIIGFDPKHIIRAKGQNIFIDDKKYAVFNPYETLRNIVPQDAISRMYAGGLIGYLSYEALNYFEESVRVKVHDLFDQFMFGVYDDGLILDKITGEVYYFYYNKNRVSTLRVILGSVATPESAKKPQDRSDSGQARMTKKVKVRFLRDTLTKKEHKEIVESVLEEIKAGNTFQCEVGFKSEFKISGNTLSIYEKLRKVNPSPFMYYLKFNDKKIIGSSPELLLRLKSGDMETFPLAGTTKRGKTEKEDQKLSRELLNNPKEMAEHNMLVDLQRNDLGKVARFGTVKVRSLADIKKFSHVQHISSEVTGVLRSDEDMFSALAAIFPMGTVTGTPKIETIKIMDRNEPQARGPYGGGVGHFGFNGDCTFALTLRSLFICGEYAYAQTSSGIVYDSKPKKEYEEVKRKLAAMKEALK